jgi:tetratricopeptide (TPR) repeat protein
VNPEPSEEDFAYAARVALERGDLRLALEQIGAALSFAPDKPSHRALLDAVLARTRRPLQLLPQSGDAFFGAAAVRALVLFRANRLNEAVTQLFAVVTFRPSAPYLRWLDDWCAGPRGVRGVSADDVARASLRLVSSMDRAALDTHAAENLRAAQALLGRLAAERPGARAALDHARAILLRRLGAPGAARSLLERALASSPDRADLWVQLGYAQAELAEDAAPALRRATGLEPHRAQLWLDLGDAELERGSLLAARQAFEQALALDCDDRERAHAEMSAAYAQFRLDPSAGFTLDPLVASRSRDRAAELERRAGSYRTHLPPPEDLLAEAVSDLIRRVRRAPPAHAVRMKLATDTPICASAQTLVRVALAAIGVEAVIVRDGELPPSSPRAAAPEDASLREEAERLAEVPFNLVTLLDPAQGEAMQAEDARRRLDSFAVNADDPVRALDHHRLAVLLHAGRAQTGARDELLLELASGPDPWLARIALVVLGGLSSRATLIGEQLLALEAQEHEDARLPALFSALLSSPLGTQEQRERWYSRLRSHQRTHRNLDDRG